MFRYDLQNTDTLPGQDFLDCVKELFEKSKDDPMRINAEEVWRPFALIRDGTPVGGVLTKFKKLCTSLQARLPVNMPSEVEAFIESIANFFRQSWGLDHQMKECEEIEAANDNSKALTES